MMDERLVTLIEQVFCDVEGKRLSSQTAQRLAQEIAGDGYKRGTPDGYTLRAWPKCQSGQLTFKDDGTVSMNNG
ncbi:hypothetical protein DB2_23 [Octadecabacter Antarctic DB virus 2]|nr:hypothetical protein DB2_23 [Octadecabacter Antarctic DB virus 2]